MLCSRSISSTTELCEPNSQTPDRSRGLSGFSRYVRGVFRSLFKPVNENKLQKDSISADQDEALQQKHQINVLEKENEEMVQELKTLLDKFVCLSDNKDTYISAGDHLKAAQDQNSVLQEKLLQLQLKIQQEEAPLMTTPGVSTEEYKDQIQALEQQKEVLQKEMEELKKKRSQESAMRMDLINLEAEKCELEIQREHIQEVIQIYSQQQDFIFPDRIPEKKSQILLLRQEREVLLEEQREIEKSKSETKALLKEFHQVIRDVEDLKKKNYDLKKELVEVNLELFERQTAAVNKPQIPAGNRRSLIPVLAKRLGPTKQVSPDAGKTQQPTTVLNEPQSPTGNPPSLIPVIGKESRPTKQVSPGAGTTKPPKAEVNKPQSPAGNPPSLKRRGPIIKKPEPIKVSKESRKIREQKKLKDRERGWR